MPFSHTKVKALSLAETRFKNAQQVQPLSLLSLQDLPERQTRRLLDEALLIKQYPDFYTHKLAGKHVALLFEKTSTRTRCSFETGIKEMGGHASFIDWKTSNFTLADLQDEAKVLSRYYDLIMARVYKHETLQTMAQHSEVPIINGLCNKEHPCQALADMMTLCEYFGQNLFGLNLTYIGDANNVCRSLVFAAEQLGIIMTVCSPKAYRLDDETVAQAGNALKLVDDPREAVAKADAIYTDTWISMGDEAQSKQRLKAFQEFQLNEELLTAAPLHALVMHCLPAHPGQEISAGVLRSPRSIVFDQAENRKYAQKAVMDWLANAKEATDQLTTIAPTQPTINRVASQPTSLSAGGMV